MTRASLGCVLAMLPAALVPASTVWGSPTGLNNIPTADTPGHGQIVFQLYYTTDTDDVDDLFAAFKGGLDLDQLMGLTSIRFEYGVDGRLGDGDSGGAGPIVAQFKLASDLSKWSDRGDLDWAPSLAAGLSNLAFTASDRDDAGQPNPYVVASKDFKVFRAHAGYAFASDNNAAFFGIDRSFEVGSTTFTPRFDLTQIDDQDQWLGSAGFIWELTGQVAVESWVSQPFDDGDTTITVKLNIGFGFQGSR